MTHCKLFTDYARFFITVDNWTLEKLSDELSRNNFVISELREPRPEPGDHKEEEWQYVKDARVTPHYLFIRGRLD